MAASITLRDALVRHKPFVECTSKQTKNTKSSPWPIPTIHVWEQFNIDTLNESYGHVLDRPLPQGYADELPPTARLEGLAVAGLENGTLRPVIGKEFPLAEAAEAHRVVMESGAIGKIVLVSSK